MRQPPTVDAASLVWRTVLHASIAQPYAAKHLHMQLDTCRVLRQFEADGSFVLCEEGIS